MSAAELASAYEELVQLTERELRCARSRRLTDLTALSAVQRALVERLPSIPSREAAEPLRRLHVLREQIDAELTQAREELVGSLAEVRRGERAARGYAPAPVRDALIRAEA